MSGSQAVIRVLGGTRLERSRDDFVALGGTLPRGFLAVLALEAGRPVSIDRLTALLWGDEAPSGVKAALQQLASRVRRALALCGLGEILHAVPPGYQLNVSPDLVDALMFRARVRVAAEAHRAGDHAGAAEYARQALELWSGNAFADLVELPLFSTLGPGLDDERWRTEELRAEALLAVGRGDEAADHLAAATALEPLRERLWVLQVSALATAGRPSEAVRCARTGIAVITAELGVPPGPELAGVEARLRDEHPAVVIAMPRRAIAARQGLLDGALRRALTNAEQAARSAAARRAHGEAVHQWQRALELLDTVAPDDDRHRLRLLLGLGAAHNMASVDAEARPVFAEAADIARRLDDPEDLAWAALGYCSDHIGFAPPPEQAAMLLEALAGLDEGEQLLRGRLLARLATEGYWTGSADRTLELAEQAAEAADAADDVEGRLQAHYARAFGCWTPDRTRRLVQVSEDYLAAARAVGDRYHELLAHRWLVPAVTELGDVDRGGVEAARAIELADDLQLSEQQWVSRVIAASHQLVVGDLGRAEQLATEALALGSVCEPLVALDYVSLFMWTLRLLQGRLDEIASLVEEAAATPGVDLPRRMGLALTRAEVGRLDESRAMLDVLTARDIDALPKDASWYIALAAMAETAAATNHTKIAGLVFERLRPYSDRIAITSVNSSGPVAHHIGVAAWAAGHHDAGLSALTDAVELADRCGAPVFGARSRLALAERLATRGDVARATSLAKAAHETALAHGLLGVERRAALVVAAS